MVLETGRMVHHCLQASNNNNIVSAAKHVKMHLYLLETKRLLIIGLQA